jgi:hypothetical protein
MPHHLLSLAELGTDVRQNSIGVSVCIVGDSSADCFSRGSSHSKQLGNFEILQKIPGLNGTQFLEETIAPSNLGMKAATTAMAAPGSQGLCILVPSIIGGRCTR